MKKAIIFLLAAGILSCNAGQQGQSEDGRQLEQSEQSEQSDIFDLAVFEAERAAWEALGLSSYRFTAQSHFVVPFVIPFTVTVRPGAEPEIRYSEWDQEKAEQMVDTGKIFPPLSGVTIDELYASMRELAVRNIELQEDTGYKIRYNKEYHYPEFFYDFWRPCGLPPPGATGLSFKITQFEVLGSGDEGL